MSEPSRPAPPPAPSGAGALEVASTSSCTCRPRSRTSRCRSTTSGCSTGSSGRSGSSRGSGDSPRIVKLIRRQPVRPQRNPIERTRSDPTGARRSAGVSWAAHQFEVYAVEAHLPKKMVAQISWFAIFFGDFTPDFLAKFWVYGFNYQRPPLRRDEAVPVAPRLAGHGHQPHALLRGDGAASASGRGSTTGPGRSASCSASPPTCSPT